MALERVVPAELFATELALVDRGVGRVLRLVMTLPIVCARECLVALSAGVPLQLRRVRRRMRRVVDRGGRGTSVVALTIQLHRGTGTSRESGRTR